MGVHTRGKVMLRHLHFRQHYGLSRRKIPGRRNSKQTSCWRLPRQGYGLLAAKVWIKSYSESPNNRKSGRNLDCSKWGIGRWWESLSVQKISSASPYLDAAAVVGEFPIRALFRRLTWRDFTGVMSTKTARGILQALRCRPNNALTQVHKELLFESTPGEVDRVAQMVKGEMEYFVDCGRWDRWQLVRHQV